MKEVDYQCYEEWEELMGEDAESLVWEDILKAFMITSFLKSLGKPRLRIYEPKER